MISLQAILAAAGAVIVALLTAFGIGRRQGKKAGQVRETRRRVEAMREAHEAQDKISSMGGDDRRDQLDEWMRRDDE